MTDEQRRNWRRYALTLVLTITIVLATPAYFLHKRYVPALLGGVLLVRHVIQPYYIERDWTPGERRAAEGCRQSG